MRLRRPLPAVQGDTLHIVGVGDNRIGKVLTLSPKHRLVLIKRDETEHLLLLGANNDIVVEGKINKARFSDALQEATMENHHE